MKDTAILRAREDLLSPTAESKPREGSSEVKSREHSSRSLPRKGPSGEGKIENGQHFSPLTLPNRNLSTKLSPTKN